MNPKVPCLPIDNNFPMMTTNPFCANGWGWLEEGVCGCVAGSPGWNPDKRGCSVKCVGVGPNVCPNCPQPFNWKLYGSIGAAALAAYFLLGKE